MNALKTVLLAVIAILLLMVVIDQARAPDQLKEVNDSLSGLTQTEQRQLDEVSAMRREFGRMQFAPTSGTAQRMDEHPSGSVAAPSVHDADYVMPAAPSGERDGNPKLGVNFLAPYDRSFFHPDWVHGTLKGFGTTTKSLNPLTDNSTTNHDIYDLINDTLANRPATYPERWYQGLATSVIISDDYKVYTFTLRQGVLWQRPAIATQPKYAWLNKDVELTADDFTFMVDMMNDPKVDCPDQRNYFEDLDHCEAVDKYTFKMVWKKKVYVSLASSLELMPLPRHIFAYAEDGSPIPKDQIGAAFNDHWFPRLRQAVGVGAYRLERYEPDVIERFVRDPDYWGCSQHFEALEYNLQVKQPDPELTAFKNGQVHAYILTPLQFKSEVLDRQPDSRFAAADPKNPKAGRSGQLGWQKVSSLGFSYIGWNMRHAPFDDVRVRQAMSYAFPKQRIIDQVFYGLGQPILSDVPIDSQYYNHDLEPYDFDLDKASALLDQAGWVATADNPIRSKKVDGKVLHLSFVVKYYAHSPEWDNALSIYANELKRIGIELTPLSLEWKALIPVYENKDFDAVVGGWAEGIDIDFYQLWHSSQADAQGGSNICGVKDPDLDKLIVQLRQTFDTAQRVAIAKKCQAMLNRLQPYTYFRSSAGVFCWQNGGPPASDTYLDGVTFGLDHLFPPMNRSHRWWHFRPQ